MKRMSLWVLIGALAVGSVSAQDTATQQQMDKLSGQLQDLLDAQAQTGKRIDAMEREISELRDKVNTPQVNDSASREDLKTLASQVQEIDRKRQDDRDLILKEIEKLGKVAAGAPVSHRNSTAPKPTVDDTAAAAVPLTGHPYVVKEGDTLSLIAKAYRDAGVKVTRAQIKAANPKVNFDVLIPGKTIFIPDPNAK